MKVEYGYQKIRDQLDRSANGLCIEIAGPTPDGYRIVKALSLRLPEHVVITNTTNPVTLFPFGDNPEIHVIDQVADIKALPYADSEVSLMLASSLPLDLHKALITSAKRVLERNGLLIVQNERPITQQLALHHGFRALVSEAVATQTDSQIYQKIGLKD